ncbi:MAG: DUF5597 domain-containing protein [Blautia sp.]|nr:DUF5597 domain-containing protein [Blautia sp.]
MGKDIFYVNGKPFIALAGEPHNSSASTVYSMKEVWEDARELGLNTLVLPVTWELIEPKEGEFDFHVQDELIFQARERGMHLIFLWFGTWKNAQCMYAPEWVKTDLKRFPRAQIEKGQNKISLKDFYGMTYTTLSYLGEETKKADAKAFAAFMEHLKQTDEKEQTVIAVQVENEVGIQGAGREHSDLADALFAGEVPQDFAEYMRSHTEEMAQDVRETIEKGQAGKTWTEVFGDTAEEIFSAYHIAGYVNEVAKAGKAAYSLPMTANCWLDKGEKPGMYPSGGPVSRMMEVWRYAAPSIDIISPDIYVRNFCEICDEYRKLGNPLFIAETASHSHAGPRLVYVIGHHHALCYSPFGFGDMGKEFGSAQGFLFGMDTEDPLLGVSQNRAEYRWYNHTLASMMDKLTEKYGTDSLQAVIGENPSENRMNFGKFGIMALFDNPVLTRKDGVCMALQESEDTFYIIANACILVPVSLEQDKRNLDILALEEGYFENGDWIMTRRLNGDELFNMSYEEPTLLRIRLFNYQ